LPMSSTELAELTEGSATSALNKRKKSESINGL
jgi:hypothetical protein